MFWWYGNSSGNIGDETQYFIASTTKLYTSAILLKLGSEGQIKLDDKISKYIPRESISGIHNYKGTDYSNEITIEQLMAHTSGYLIILKKKCIHVNHCIRNSPSDMIIPEIFKK